jgi:signal transduction histidine kinase
VHSHSIAGFLSAWVLAYVAIAAFCIPWRLRRQRDGDFFVFGLLSLALAVHTAGAAALHVARGPEAVRAALVVSDAGRILATAFMVRVVVQLVQVRVPRRAFAWLYGIAALLEAANVADLFRDIGAPSGAPIDLAGVRLFEAAMPVRPLSVAVSLASLACGLFAATAFVRAVLRARRPELLPPVWGAAALLVSMLCDAFNGLRGLGAPLASPYGYAAFVMGVVMSLLSRYASLQRKLEGHAAELKQRSAELARSYEDLRATQAELVRKEQLAAVGELSAVIAHEVRNPLAIITTAVATLRREGLVEDDRQTLLGILDEEASRLNRLVGDLLRYARPVRCERQLVAPREIVERALSLAQARTDVSVTLTEREPIEKIQADPQLLRQVLENIVNNALQAMPGGGTLTVMLEPQTVEGSSGVEIQVKDTGEGMDTTVRDRAFDPFFTTRASGTGLGLAIVARIVDAHGGRLKIYSDVGEGTAVHVFLPQHGEPPAVSRRSMPPDSRTSSLPPMPAELRRAIVSRKEE